jgi:hypothetical protein
LDAVGRLRITKRRGVVKNVPKRRSDRSVSSGPDDPAQHKRFIDMAREVEVDESEGAFDRAFDRVAEKAITKSPAPRKGASRGGS